MKIKDKVIIVTGGANGIGKACTLKFLEKEAKVIVADIDIKNGKKLEKKLGQNCYFVKTDITKEIDIIKLKNSIIDRYGRIDTLINNVARQKENSFFNIKIDEFRNIIDANLNGTFICSNI